MQSSHAIKPRNPCCVRTLKQGKETRQGQSRCGGPGSDRYKPFHFSQYYGDRAMPSCDSETLEKCVQDPAQALLHWEALVECVASDEESTLEAATEALENCGALPESALPRLTHLLSNPSPNSLGPQRLYWLCTLAGRFGESGLSLQPWIVSIASDASIDLAARERAAWCLGELGPVDPKRIDSLKQAMTGAPERLRRLIEAATSVKAVA